MKAIITTIFLTIVSLFSFQESLKAQVFEAWVQTEDGGSAEDQGSAIAVDASGNVYVTELVNIQR